jgi:predicted DsbA family dithiol-disulfide isomerase
MQQFPYRDQVEVIWRSYQLDPFAVTHPNKTTLQMMVEEKGLPSNRINDYIGYINEMAKEVGLDYHLDKTLVVNSFKAHRLLHLAKDTINRTSSKKIFLRPILLKDKILTMMKPCLRLQISQA